VAQAECEREKVTDDSIHALYYVDLASELNRAGRPHEAISACRRAIELKPDCVEAHYKLGMALKASGQFVEAASAYRDVIRLKPDYVEAFSNLGNILRLLGQLDEAIECHREAIRQKPDLAHAHNNLGNVLKDMGQVSQAISSYRQAIVLKPDLVQAHNNLGSALKDMGQLTEAIAACREAIRLQPAYAGAYVNLGSALQDNGQLGEAIAAFRRATVLKPDLALAHSNLGNALNFGGRFDEAIAESGRAIQLNPDLLIAHANLGNAYQGIGQIDEAIASYQRALAIGMRGAALSAPSDASGAAEFRQEAFAEEGRVRSSDPNFLVAHTNLIFAMQMHPACGELEISRELRRWNQMHAAPLKKFIEPHANDCDPARRLRVGYVSGDLKDHVAGRQLLPLFSQHDREQFEIFAYANVVKEDAVSDKLRLHCDKWRNIAAKRDPEAAALIREDKIDLLIDLSLHTAGGRLLIFARKPAPVQATWLGYPGSTGMEAIDYRLTDPWLDPVGHDDRCYAERTIRLPETFWCYDPLVDGPEVNMLPCAINNPADSPITFGCLNSFHKVNDRLLTLWAQILNTTPRSRLMMFSPEGTAQRRALERLEREGIAGDRVQFVSRQTRVNYLRTYHQIDIGLDTSPFCGGITTCDALWMGVPVITLAGQTVGGRGGVSLLSNVGLCELIARTPEELVRIARALAGDIPRLAEIRRNLRMRMQGSPLMDAPRFARNMEAAYREMWHIWCKGGALVDVRNEGGNNP
jgi:predicted O-linked N-acetylglucosamine transferase (SPINDLY family)